MAGRLGPGKGHEGPLERREAAGVLVLGWLRSTNQAKSEDTTELALRRASARACWVTRSPRESN